MRTTFSAHARAIDGGKGSRGAAVSFGIVQSDVSWNLEAEEIREV